MSEDRGELASSATGSPVKETRWAKFVDRLKALKPQAKEKAFQLPQPDKSEERKFGAAFSILGRVGYQNIDDLKKVFSHWSSEKEYRNQQFLFAPDEQTSLGKETGPAAKSIHLKEVSWPNYDEYFTVLRHLNLMDKSKAKSAAASVGVFAEKVSDPDRDLKIQLTLTNKGMLVINLLLSQEGVQVKWAGNSFGAPSNVWKKGELQDQPKMTFAHKELRETWGINLDEVAKKPVDVEQTVKAMIETPAARGPFSPELIKFK